MNTTQRFALLAALLPLATAPAQKDASAIKDNPKVEQNVDELMDVLRDTKAARRKGARDDEAIAAIDALVTLSKDGLSRGDLEMTVKTLRAAFLARPTRKPENIKLYRAAAVALGKIGGRPAAAVLHQIYEARRPFPNKKEWVPMRAILLTQIGKTKSERMIEFLYEEAARSPEDALKAAAGEALGNFADVDWKQRREIVNKLIIEWGRQESKATPIDPANLEAQNAKRTLMAISDKWMTTLSKLTGERFRSYRDWNDWYNENKNDPRAWKIQ